MTGDTGRQVDRITAARDVIRKGPASVGRPKNFPPWSSLLPSPTPFPSVEGRKKIAVIGSGVAGLSAAWLLGERHDVTLYEKDSWVGGHAHTVEVSTPVGPVAVDTGFIVYNERNYPNLTALFAHLGVATAPSDMSFSASMDEGGFEYSSASVGRYAGQRRNILRPRFWRMTRDLLRFYRDPAVLLEAAAREDVTLGAFLEREGYSPTFVEDHILPMSAAIWSTTPAEIRRYPLAAFARFFSSHGLLSITDRPDWRTVAGGSREYVAKLAAGIATFRRGAKRVTRTASGVIVEDHEGRTDRFTDVVLASHADESLALLTDADRLERQTLGAFRYTSNEAVLHSDARLMPRTRRVWSSWNFIGQAADRDEQQLTVTYWMNRLQGIDNRAPLFVTLNPRRQPAPEMVLGRFQYSHPFFDQTALGTQSELWRLQGRRRTWFCGAYFGYGFHEDALQSGLAVAEALGGMKRPWRHSSEDDRIARAAPPEQEIAA